MSYFLSVFFGTFVLEDVALATAIAFVANHRLNFGQAFSSCFLGICLGDLGLYLIGYSVLKLGVTGKFPFISRVQRQLNKSNHDEVLNYTILVSRMIPGTRTPTYLSAGFFGYPFLRFLGLTLISVFIWVSLGLFGGEILLKFFSSHWLIAVLLTLPCLHLIKNLVLKLIDPWKRRALMIQWRKYFYFEFWPPMIFYLPIVPIYIFNSLKYGSFLLPFYSNPHLKHGGLIGESKWDFLKHLKSGEPSTLASRKISRDLSIAEIQNIKKDLNITSPFILKPDVGQRGFGVRIISSDEDLQTYLLVAQSELILQAKSQWSREAGIFYIRTPENPTGFIFSITEKKFPWVLGDGNTKLGDLILNDPRAKLIAATYFARFENRLNEIPAVGQKKILAECGNHCQGAIFEDGFYMNSPELNFEIDRIAKQIPDFYFGRLDIRYKDADSLKQGKGFEIIEINGAGAEATHIWDARMPLINAYKVLFRQWSYLFKIGNYVRHHSSGHRPIRLYSFAKDCLLVIFRKDPLQISS